MCAAARPEAVAVLAEAGIKDRLQYLQQRLLDQTIRYRRDAELALAVSPGLGIVTRRTGWAGTSPTTVAPGSRATPCAGVRRSGRCPARRRRLAPLLARTRFQRLLQVLSRQSCQEQPWPCALRFMTRARASSLPGSDNGFTVPYSDRPLRRTSDALPCASSCRRTLLLVRPFTGAQPEGLDTYYGLC
jgi:hypothetical protein